MVNHKTIIRVLEVLREDEAKPLRAVTTELNATEAHIFKCLKILIDMGLVKKINFIPPIPSGNGHGLNRIGYKKIQIK